MSQPITILLAEDHQVVREGLRLLLGAEPGFAVVGQAPDGQQAIASVERLRPTVLVVDVSLPVVGGLDVTGAVVERCPATRVVVLSMHAEEGFVLEALRRGASAYVLKDGSAADLVHAIREVAGGRQYLSPALRQRAVDFYIRQASEPESGGALTPREREVLRFCADGLRSAEIGRRLGISPRTVETHRTNLMRKLKLHRLPELVRYALREGLLPQE